MKPSKVMPVVHNLLLHHPQLRDSNLKLMFNVWYKELRNIGEDINTMTVPELLNHLISKNITTPESISRARRKVQEEHQCLRGSNYKGRQESQKETRKDLGYAA